MIRYLIEMPPSPKSMFIALARQASKLYQIAATSTSKSPGPSLLEKGGNRAGHVILSDVQIRILLHSSTSAA